MVRQACYGKVGFGAVRKVLLRRGRQVTVGIGRVGQVVDRRGRHGTERCGSAPNARLGLGLVRFYFLDNTLCT